MILTCLFLAAAFIAFAGGCVAAVRSTLADNAKDFDYFTQACGLFGGQFILSLILAAICYAIESQ